MKVSGFTIVRNAIKFNYPVTESINSILPICDEFIVNVGDSDDDTLNLIKSIKSDKIKIIHSTWDFSKGKEVLSEQTNIALKECTGDWAFYLQTDEVIHEADLPRLKKIMQKYLDDKNVDALRFRWFHFYGSYYRYRIDHGWYQKQDRIIRNNGEVRSFGDAYGFERKDGTELKRKNTGAFLYHYGHVNSENVMLQRRVNAVKIGFASLKEHEQKGEYFYEDLNSFPIYFGTHPAVMKNKIASHATSQEDKATIHQRLWWHPLKIFNVRYKTGKRIKANV